MCIHISMCTYIYIYIYIHYITYHDITIHTIYIYTIYIHYIYIYMLMIVYIYIYICTDHITNNHSRLFYNKQHICLLSTIYHKNDNHHEHTIIRNMFMTMIIYTVNIFGFMGLTPYAYIYHYIGIYIYTLYTLYHLS